MDWNLLWSQSSLNIFGLKQDIQWVSSMFQKQALTQNDIMDFECKTTPDRATIFFIWYLSEKHSKWIYYITLRFVELKKVVILFCK